MSLPGADDAQAPRARGVYHWLMEGLGLLAGLILGAQALLITYDVISRNVGVATAPWALEITEYGLSLATFLAAPWVLYHAAHVRIEILVGFLPKRAGRVVEFVADTVGLLICGVFVYLSVGTAISTRDFGSVIVKMLAVPEWWLMVPVVVSFSLLTAEFGRRLLLARRA